MASNKVFDLSDVRDLERLYVISCIIYPISDSEKVIWHSDASGRRWVTCAVERIAVLIDTLNVRVKDKSVLDGIKFANFLFCDHDYAEGLKNKMLELFRHEIGEYLKTAEKIIDRIHGVNLAFISFAMNSEDSNRSISNQIIFEDKEVGLEIQNREFFAANIPRVILYGERMSALLNSNRKISDDLADVQKWEKDVIELHQFARLQHETGLEQWIRSAFEGGIITSVSESEIVKRLICTESSLLTLADNLVPWDSYDNEKVLGRTRDEIAAYEFFRMYQCYVVAKDYFYFVPEFIDKLELQRKYYNRRKNISVKEEPLRYFMSHRFFHGVRVFCQESKETTTGSFGQSIGDQIPKRYVVSAVEKRAMRLRRDLGLEESEVKNLLKLTEEERDKEIEFMAKYRERYYAALKIKEEPVSVSFDPVSSDQVFENDEDENCGDKNAEDVFLSSSCPVTPPTLSGNVIVSGACFSQDMPLVFPDAIDPLSISGANFECDFCKMVFVNPEERATHLAEDHNYRCSQCPKILPSQATVDIHLREQHGIMSVKSYADEYMKRSIARRAYTSKFQEASRSLSPSLVPIGIESTVKDAKSAEIDLPLVYTKESTVFCENFEEVKKIPMEIGLASPRLSLSSSSSEQQMAAILVPLAQEICPFPSALVQIVDELPSVSGQLELEQRVTRLECSRCRKKFRSDLFLAKHLKRVHNTKKQPKASTAGIVDKNVEDKLEFGSPVGAPFIEASVKRITRLGSVSSSVISSDAKSVISYEPVAKKCTKRGDIGHASTSTDKISSEHLPLWAQPEIVFSQSLLGDLVSSSIIPVAVELRKAMENGSVNADSDVGKLALKLFDGLENVAVDLKKSEFDTKKKRETFEARQKFADLYANKNSDLPGLFANICALAKSTSLVSELKLSTDDPSTLLFNEQLDDSFYYDDDFENVPVEIGKKPYPIVFPAKKDWIKSDEEFDVIEYKGIQLRQIAFGLVICLTEEIELTSIVDSYINGIVTAAEMEAENKKAEEKARDAAEKIDKKRKKRVVRKIDIAERIFGEFSNGTICQAAMLQFVIRMFWPGRSHKVFSDPRGVRGGKKPAFHRMRLIIAADYLYSLMSFRCEQLKVTNMNSIVKTREILQKKLSNQFDRLRVKAQYTFATDIGFGQPWYEGYFKDGNGDSRNVKIFEKSQDRKRSISVKSSADSSSLSKKERKN